MIFDSLKNHALYHALCPRFERAFDYILSTDLAALAAGRHAIDGDDIFVNVIECDLKKPADAKLEIHDEYIDIQVVVSGLESFGWSERADVTCRSAISTPGRIFGFSTMRPRPTIRSSPGNSRSSCPTTRMRRWWARAA